MSKETNRKTKSNWLEKNLLVVLGSAGFLTIAGSYSFYRWHFNGGVLLKRDAWAQFGDFIGGVTNPVIGLLALIGLLATIRLQQKEFRELTAEMQEQKELLKLQVQQQEQQRTEENFRASMKIVLDSIDEITLQPILLIHPDHPDKLQGILNAQNEAKGNSYYCKIEDKDSAENNQNIFCAFSLINLAQKFYGHTRDSNGFIELAIFLTCTPIDIKSDETISNLRHLVITGASLLAENETSGGPNRCNIIYVMKLNIWNTYLNLIDGRSRDNINHILDVGRYNK